MARRPPHVGRAQLRAWVLASKGWRRVAGSPSVLEPCEAREMYAARLALQALERVEADEAARRREAARQRRGARG